MNCPICSHYLLAHELCRSDPAHLARKKQHCKIGRYVSSLETHLAVG